METNTKSIAYQFIEFMWIHNSKDSWIRLNQTMHDTLNLAISGNLQFSDNDFNDIEKNMRGRYWFGVNSNGKGIGEGFYVTAIMCNNPSAYQSFEKWSGIKPFISEKGLRARLNSVFDDNEYRYTVTGFDYETKRIYLVAYLQTDWEHKGRRKLFNFDNKEWLTFRKTIKEF